MKVEIEFDDKGELERIRINGYDVLFKNGDNYEVSGHWLYATLKIPVRLHKGLFTTEGEVISE